ncbi:MAG: hypothetical protein K2L84_10035 [Muribaculaceae bacterium]|nr:hypothetical protein [Muribaculaceae bacterium]
MKRFYYAGLLLTMLLGVSFNSHALQVTFEWEIPGSVQIKTGNISSEFIALAADQTSYVYETTSSFGYVYIYAADGYYVPGAEADGREFFYNSYTKSVSVTCNSSLNGKTVKVNCIKLERNDILNLNVENGVNSIEAKFASEYTPKLQNGFNSVYFNPAIDGDLTITLNKALGASSIHSVTLNGTPQTIKDFYGTISCTVAGLANGDVLNVRVFENDDEEGDLPKDCTLNIVLPEGFENCIKNIRNYTTSSFIYPTDIVDNKLATTEGTDLQFNLLGDDYTYTGFKLNGEDISSDYNSYSNTIRFTVPKGEESTFEIEGKATVYQSFIFTGYIANPEGVIIYEEGYNKGANDLTEGGEALSADKTFSVATADGSKKTYEIKAAEGKAYTFNASAKQPTLYVAPKDGWFIEIVACGSEAAYVVEAKTKTSGSDVEYLDTDFYVIARKYEKDAEVKVSLNGDQAVRFTANTTLSNLWDNPESYFSIAAGDNNISYNNTYDAPFSIRALGASTFQVYLDGAAVTLDDNNIASVTPYYSTTDKEHSQIVIYANNTGKGGTTAKVTLNQPANYGTKLLYSNVRREVPVTATATSVSQTLLRGTEVAIKPATQACKITVNDEVVYSVNDASTSLNAAGEYVFALNGSLFEVYVEAEAKTVAIAALDPVAGSTLKEISTIEVVVPIIDENMEKMMYTSLEAIGGITLQRAGGEAIHAVEIGEPGIKYNNMWQPIGQSYPVTFASKATEAGEYTLTIPAGTFYEVAWDDNADGFVKVDGGVSTATFTATYTIDPDLLAAVDNFSFVPAAGSTVKSISVIRMVYNTLTPMDMYRGFSLDYEAQPTLSNGSVEVPCMIGNDYEAEDNLTIMIIPIDRNWEETPVTEAGTWTLSIPAGIFSYNGDVNQAVEATFTIDPNQTIYPLSPAPGKVTGSLSKITITFPGANSVEYNDRSITLTGEGVNKSTTEVLRGSDSNVYVIDFGSIILPEGSYTLTIPANAFTIDGTTESEEIIAVYNYSPSWVITPASGSELTELADFTVEFPYATEAEFIGGTFSAMLVQGGRYAAGTSCTKVENAAHPTFKFALMEGAQLPSNGKITFCIEEGAFLIDGTESSEMAAEYSYAPAISLDYIADPSNGTIVYNEYGFYWTFIFGEQFTVSSTAGYTSKITVKLGDRILAPNSDYMTETEGNMILMGVINPDAVAAGTLSVSIEEGAFSISGTPSPAIEHTWEVVAPKEYSYTLTPDPDTTNPDLSKITVSFPEAATGHLYVSSFVSLTRGYEYRGELTITEVADAEVPTFEIAVANAPTEEGIYVFTARSGAFTLDGSQASPEILVEYTYDANGGITGVTVGTACNVTVVTLDGKVIFENADKARLSELSAGFYIVNGKKVFLRK